MNDHPPANGSRGSDPYRTLRLVALIAAIAGVILLAALAFALSYGGIHALARQAGMSAGMARLFPIIFDAMLVVSCVAVLLLRGAGWWRRGYAWLITLVLLAAVAAGDAVHAAGTHLPHRPAAITAAVLPWVLLLLAFSLLLSMLRQFRHHRGALARQQAVSRAAAGLDPAVTLTGSTPPAANRSGLDALLSRDRTGPAAGQGTGPTNATLPSRAPDAGGTKTARRPAQTGTGAPRNGRANARPAAAKPAKSTEPTITQPIAAAGTTKSAAKALDAADEPAQAQPTTAAAGAVAAAAAAGLASGSSPRPADGASAAGRLPPAPGTPPVPATPDQPAGLAPAATPPAPGDPATHEPAEKPAADRAPATQAPAGETLATDTPADQVPAARPAGTGASPGQPAPTPPPAAEEVTGRSSEEVTGQADEAALADEAGPAAPPAGPDKESPAATAGDQARTEEPPTDETATEQTTDAAPTDAAPTDAAPTEQPPGDPASEAIRVPAQPMRAPVPAPSPHFDRLRSTPTPADEDSDTDS